MSIISQVFFYRGDQKDASLHQTPSPALDLLLNNEGKTGMEEYLGKIC